MTNAFKPRWKTLQRNQVTHQIVDNVHMDIIPVPTSVGNNHILFTVDENSDVVIGIPIPTKSTPQLIKAANVIIGMYHQRGHTISHFTSDNETYVRNQS